MFMTDVGVFLRTFVTIGCSALGNHGRIAVSPVVTHRSPIGSVEPAPSMFPHGVDSDPSNDTGFPSGGVSLHSLLSHASHAASDDNDGGYDDRDEVDSGEYYYDGQRMTAGDVRPSDVHVATTTGTERTLALHGLGMPTASALLADVPGLGSAMRPFLFHVALRLVRVPAGVVGIEAIMEERRAIEAHIASVAHANKRAKLLVSGWTGLLGLLCACLRAVLARQQSRNRSSATDRRWVRQTAHWLFSTVISTVSLIGWQLPVACRDVVYEWLRVH